MMLRNKINILCAAAAMAVVMPMGTAVHGDVMYSGKFVTTDYWDGGKNHDAIFEMQHRLSQILDAQQPIKLTKCNSSLAYE